MLLRDSSDGRSYCLTQKCSRASRALPHLDAPEPRLLCQPTFNERVTAVQEVSSPAARMPAPAEGMKYAAIIVDL
jgi:hypothetical protein